MTDPGRQPDAAALRPWEAAGAVRRDCAPHRGQLLVRLGRVGVDCVLLTPVLILPALVALPLGVVTWALARHDLAGMRAGLMDPAARGPVERVARRGLAAALLALA